MNDLTLIFTQMLGYLKRMADKIDPDPQSTLVHYDQSLMGTILTPMTVNVPRKWNSIRWTGGLNTCYVYFGNVVSKTPDLILGSTGPSGTQQLLLELRNEGPITFIQDGGTFPFTVYDIVLSRI